MWMTCWAFCDQVLRFNAGVSREKFAADPMRYDATVRNIELIGEAATHIPLVVKKGRAFFTAVAGRGLDRFAAQITRNIHFQSEQLRVDELGGGLKVDFSGTTTYADLP
jgi:hypothetical protein